MDKKQTKKEWFSEGLRFECTQCGNCCTGPEGYVWFDEIEAKAMAAVRGVTIAEFLRLFAKKVHGRWSLDERKTVHGLDCVFLERDSEGKALCSVYGARPKQCRTWPFWPENLSSRRSWTRAGQNCPGMDKGTLYPVEHIRVTRDSNPPDC